MTNQELRLSVGASPGQRVVAVVAGVLLAAVGAAFVALPLVADGLLRRLTGPGDAFASYEEARDLPPGLLPPGLRDSADPNQSGPSPFIGLCGLPFVLLGLYLVLRVLRTAAWLDGSRARVRGALRTRTVDLATARIESGVVSYREADDDGPGGGARVRAILATNRGSTRGVTIPLRGMGLPSLPPPELRALAEAITTGRPGDGRDTDAHAVADHLRRLAERPSSD
ncbi:MULTISPECIES: hypothetical protein [Micromonospora]|uniref:PH domain-containing protein n=1 Tax=Micromonospora vinacea TaxID=709878 RepID=A0ABS0K1D5_9ACTN|nr:hypothetical protein [Micromonospora vinacea]MBG6102441.1 hypothetical protein [Micromonospora vinacea]WSZ74782.1 hypothetical protein OH804_22950 [Micromonospora sp. NBC_00860]WTA68731.1 hypothetical protein OHB51_06105 [Micromonospora sp. NBC_00855]